MPKNHSTFNQGIGRLFDTTSGYVMEFFFENNKMDYSMSEIYRHSNVSVKSLEKILPRFVRENIVFVARRVGKNNMFKLCDNPRVLGLIECHIQMKEEKL